MTRLGRVAAAAGSLAVASGACGWGWAVYWQAWPGYLLALVLLPVIAVRGMPVVVASVVMPIAFTAGFALPFQTGVLVSTGLWIFGATAGLFCIAAIAPLVATAADRVWRKRAARPQ